MLFKSLKVRIATYALVCATVLALVFLASIKRFVPNSSSPLKPIHLNPTPLGNSLSIYFYYISQMQDEDLLQRHKLNLEFKNERDLQTFYRKLNWGLRVKNVAYKSEPLAAWNQIGFDGVVKPNYMQYWQTLRPLIQEIFASSLPPIVSNVPVVHFRCSDAPFIKHTQYHLPKVSSVLWITEQIKQRGYDEVLMLCCTSHGGLYGDNCSKYVDFYKQLFVKENIDVHVRCNSVMEDFALMVNSPLLVSLNASSFSFMAGISKDPKNWISANMGTEVEGTYHLQTNVDWILDPNPPLLHTQVDTYSDTQRVFAQLRDL